MNHFSDSQNIKKIKIGTTSQRPVIFKKNNYLKCFYILNEKNTLCFNDFNFIDFKSKTVLGKEGVESFNSFYNSNNDNSIILWKMINQKRFVYFSPMDKDFNGYSQIVVLKFNQNNDLPLCYIDEKKFTLLFKDGLQAKRLICPLNEDIRNIHPENFDKDFEDYKIEAFYNINNTNMTIIKKSVEISKLNVIDKVIVCLFDADFKGVKNIQLENINGTVSNFQLVLINKKNFLFWIETNEQTTNIRYLSIEF